MAQQIDLSQSHVLVALLKGVVSKAVHPKLWPTLLDSRLALEEYLSKIGLTLIIQEQDGCAYLKQKSYENEGEEIPRLIPRRQLPFLTSLLLVLFREEMVEQSKGDMNGRFICGKEAIIEKTLPYLKESSDNVKQRREVESSLKKIEEMGFIHSLNSADSDYEILPLVRGFVDAQWLDDFDNKLQAYKSHHHKGGEVEEGDDESI